MESFEQLGLSQPVLQAIEALGFETPTPIQSKAIPQLLENTKDFVGLAQTGTGKTAAFGLPLIQLVDPTQNYTQALVLAPTRELCLQITKEFTLFAKFVKRLKILPVYGGSDIVRQIKALKSGIHVIVATPGRLRDLIRRGAVKIEKINYVVLDEADEMLNMGFKEELDDILQNTPDEKLTWLFSATMPKEVRRIASEYMDSPNEVSVGTRNSVNTDISHQYVFIRRSVRYEALKRFLDISPDMFGLVFCRTRNDTRDLAEQLIKDGYNADALHGDLSQAQRDRVMSRFRVRHVKILAATDVAARGIDVQDITHVFHYNIPDDRSFYTHRAGRTGRAGRKGISLIFAHPKDEYVLKQMERQLKFKFEKAHIPTGHEICEKRTLQHINKIKSIEVSEEINEILPKIEEVFGEMTKEDLIKQIASLSFNRFLSTYKNAPDLNPMGKSDRKKRDKGGFKRLFINVGEIEVGDKAGFLRFVCNQCNIPGSVIGKITLNRTFTFFDIDESIAPTVINKFKGSSFEGRPIRIDIDEGRKGGGSSKGGGSRGRDRNKSRGRNRKYDSPSRSRNRDWKKRKK